MARKIICPFCFEEVRKDEVEYRCVDKRCSAAGEPDRPYSAYLRAPNDLPLGHVFTPSKRGFFGDGDVSCDVCHSHSPNPICPRCHNPLPPSTINGTNNIISIVGTRGSGKSHYIAVLIDELRKRIGHSMGAEIRNYVALGDGGYNVEDLYRETKYHRLYEEQRQLDLTRTDMGMGLLEHDKIPLIYIWNYLNRSFGREKAFTLSFFDAAGEDLQNEEAIATVARYLRHSKGIIFLVDPLQIESVRNQVEAQVGRELTSLAGIDATSSFENVLANVTTLIRNSRGLKEGKEIDIPVAITFSKFDEILPIATNALTIRQQSPHCSHKAFVSADQKAVDGELRSLLENWGEGAMISNVRGNFRDASFFAVSSLGIDNAPDTGGRIKKPRPHRVEDPLLWVMSRYRLVSQE